jgi:hypothetical protein
MAVSYKPEIAGGRTLSRMRRGSKATKNNKDKPSRKKRWLTGPFLAVTGDSKTVGAKSLNYKRYGSWPAGKNPYLPA